MEEPGESPTVTVIERPAPPEDFGRAESLAMANYLCANRALLSGEYLYTLDFNVELRPVLGRYRVVDNTLREFTVLVEDCVASYLAEDGDRLCYVREGRIEALPTDGGKPVTLCEDARTLQLFGGKLYYLDGAGRLCRMERDGSGKTVLTDGPCDRPYVLSDGLLLAQKGEEHALYLCVLEGEGEWRVSDGAGYDPLLIGQTLYFTRETASGEKQLCRFDLADDSLSAVSDMPLRGTAEFFYDRSWQTRLARAGELLRQSILPLEGGEAESCDYSGYHLLDYVGAGLRVDAVYEADGRLNSFMLYTPDGGVIRYFGGSVIEP